MSNIQKLKFPESIEEMDSFTSWNFYFLKMAKLVSQKSKDPSTKVGAVITDKNHRIISTGYNGLPQGYGDPEDILNDRDKKLKQIIHAEENAIIFAKRDLTGNIIYLWPLISCSSCTSKIIQSGIKTLITVSDDNPRWQLSFKISRDTYEKCGVDVYEYNIESFQQLEGIDN